MNEKSSLFGNCGNGAHSTGNLISVLHKIDIVSCLAEYILRLVMQAFVLCLDEGLKLKVNHGVLNFIKYSGKVILSTLLFTDYFNFVL